MPTSNSNLAMLTQIPYTQKWFGTCPVCFCTVDLDAEARHAATHSRPEGRIEQFGNPKN